MLGLVVLKFWTIRSFPLVTCAAVLCVLGLTACSVEGAEPTLVHQDVEAGSQNQAAHEEFFELQIRPILVERCGKCHGSEQQWAGLRVDSRAALLLGGESGAAVVPGDAEASRLIHAIRDRQDLAMPPEEPLPAREVALLVEWVARGAPWPLEQHTPADQRAALQAAHWAFQPVQRPVLPTVGQPEWCQSEIDYFVLQKLEEAGLPPSAPIDRRALIRRVTYDLTGLPPSAEDVAAFVKNDDPEAYPRLVEALLGSAAYGEHWGRYWLDVARYADTKGYVYAREERFWVHAPAYRDWVIRAFQQDLPYDRFLLLQLAADQVAPGDLSSQAAMGYLTLGRRFLGVQREIYDDRIDVVCRGTMGLTAACARCHDHKYDPIPTADYYSLYGVFANSTEHQLRLEPPRADQTEFEQELFKRQSLYQQTWQESRVEAERRARQRVAEYFVAQTELGKFPQEGFDVILLSTDLIPATVRAWNRYLMDPRREHDPIFRPWFVLINPPLGPAESFVERVERFVAQSPAGSFSPTIHALLTPSPASPLELAQRYGALFAKAEQQVQERKAPVPTEGASVVQTQVPQEQQATEPLEESLFLLLEQVLYGPESPCQIPAESIVTTETYFDSETCEKLWRLQGEVDRWLVQSPQAPAYAMQLIDKEYEQPARVLLRGNPATPGKLVQRHFLSVLAGPSPAPFAQGSGRLELARAIVDPANPLTARVWANRVWQHHFGAGLVKTASDFGLRAAPPSHPELLDWLACELVEHGWSTRHLHRLLVLSATYQQQSTASPLARDRDPENRLLSHQQVHRLTFEEFRDTLLQVAGRLDRTAGGRATDLWTAEGANHRRRTVYGLIDRQFLPSTLRVFDFANPDLHIPARSETTVPQQALFALNHPFMAAQARAIIERLGGTPSGDQFADAQSEPARQLIERLYATLYQRPPTQAQLLSALEYVQSAQTEPPTPPPPGAAQWSYGVGRVVEQKVVDFSPLPYCNGDAWQGGPKWPHGTTGWAQLTATGGHPGNDLQHAVVRRWTAPRAGCYRVTSLAQHAVAAGDGIHCCIISSQTGLLLEQKLHQSSLPMNLAELQLEAGDTLDFVVDIAGELNSDQFLWAPSIEQLPAGEGTATALSHWSAEQDFFGRTVTELNSWEQLAQVLLLSNELLFVD